MALDPEKFNELQNMLDDVVEMAPVKGKYSEFVIEEVLGPALRDVEELVDESRPPRLYVFGRSGAGKSSLINALANRKIADIGAVEPTTVESQLYHISFPEQYANWDVVDSRGLFEAVPPDGAVPEDTVDTVRQDLEQYRPDILLHVMTPDQVRAGQEDFETIEQLREELGGLFPPVVYCLNKIDIHMSPGDEWPPHENPTLAGDIKGNLDFVARVLDEQDRTPFWQGDPLYGQKFDSEEHVGVVPVHLNEPYWNVGTLSWLIGDFLPADARLQFVQAQQRDELMRRMSRNLTRRFTGIATGVGAAPVPVADIAVLAPLQILLVVIVGSFSCREIGLPLAKEYLSALGGTGVAGLGARSIARSLIQLIPISGQAISAAVAGGGTYAIGRSAEKFFFDDELVKPRKFLSEGKNAARDLVSQSR